MTSGLQHDIKGTTLYIWSDGFRASKITCDFLAAGFHPRVANGLIRAVVAQQMGNHISSVRIVWRSLKFLGAALVARELEPTAPISNNALLFLKQDLEKSKIGDRTCQTYFKLAEGVLKWCERNLPDVTPKDLDYHVGHFSLAKKKAVRQPPSEDTIKNILAICYERIEATEQRLAEGLRIMNDTSLDAPPISQTLRTLLKLGGGRVPTQKILNAASHLGLGKYGGIPKLRMMLEPMQEDIFFFYLAIVVQTSGNPQSILELKIDAIERHPVRTDLERIVWSKYRSGRQQYADFPRSKEWGAPNILRRLMTLNKQCRIFAPRHLCNQAFLSSNKKSTISVLTWQGLHNLFDDFIAKYELPKFNLKDLRVSGAVLHHQAAKSQVAAQHRLNHVEISTTEIYTPREGRRRHYDAVILKFQGELVKMGKISTTPWSTPAPDAPIETVFGFSCRDSLSGAIPGSRAGVECLEFLQCAGCANALIPVDDVSVISRLLATIDALNDAKKRAIKGGWVARYDRVYAPVRSIIMNDILPHVADGVKLKASIHAKHEAIIFLD